MYKQPSIYEKHLKFAFPLLMSIGGFCVTKILMLRQIDHLCAVHNRKRTLDT